MQTFLPYADFGGSAHVLDRARLGKQRIEARQILEGLLYTEFNGMRASMWRGHPAVAMWEGHEQCLFAYLLAVYKEWTIGRGYKDNTTVEWMQKFAFEMGILTEWDTERDSCEVRIEIPSIMMPWWLGHEPFHLSHRSNLIRKKPEHYGPLWPGVPDDLPYLWPVEEGGR